MKLLAQILQIPIITISQLNRNIENRSDKEPLLSDLKESGCMSYKNNIDIKCKYRKNVNIKNINKKIINIISFKNFKKQCIRIRNNISINDNTFLNAPINLNHKYIFRYIKNTKNLNVTYNHQYLSQSVWVESGKILSCTTINMYIDEEQNFLQKQYISHIKLNNYSKSYDINQNSHFTITTSKIVTHNSIEQDADIILNLYEKEYEQKNETKIIDIKVSKNRNGKTGYCKLIFLPEISKFQNIEEF